MSNSSISLPVDFLFNALGLGQVQGDVKKASGEIEKDFSGALGEVGRQAVRLAAAFKSVQGAMDFIGGSLETYKEFEKAIVQTGINARASAGDIANLRDYALELGAAAEDSAVDIAKAMQSVAKAGLNVGDTVAAMSGIISMADVGLVSIEQSASIATETMRGFQIEDRNLNYVVGELTQTVSTSSLSLQQLSGTLRMLGPLAAETGVSLSQVTAGAALMAQAGVGGRMAMMGLREMIGKLDQGLGGSAQKMAKGVKGLKDLGLTWEDVSDEAGNLNLVKSVEALENAFKRMGTKPEDQMKALRSVFGARAGISISAMLGKGASEFKAREMETAFAGVKQQILGVIEQARVFPDTIAGLNVTNDEVSKGFLLMGSIGSENVARLDSQMRSLGMKMNWFGDTVSELPEGSLRAVDGLYRIRDAVDQAATRAQKLEILHQVFGENEEIYARSVKAFIDCRDAMGGFADQIVRANSAMDIENTQLNTLAGSIEMLSNIVKQVQTIVGELISPIARVAALAMRSVVSLLLAGNTLNSVVSDFYKNVGNMDAMLEQMYKAFNRFSTLGKVFAGLFVLVSVFGALTVVSGGFLAILAGIPIIFGAMAAGVVTMTPLLLLVVATVSILSDKFQFLGTAASDALGLLASSAPSNFLRTVVKIGQAFEKMTGIARPLSRLPDWARQLVISGSHLVNSGLRMVNILGKFLWMLPVILKVAAEALPMVGNAIGTTVKGIASAGSVNIGTSTGAVSNVGISNNGMLTGAVSGVEYMVAGVIDAFELMAKIIGYAIAAILHSISMLWTLLKAIINDLVVNFTKTIQAFIMGILRLGMRAVEALAGILASGYIFIKSWVMSSLMETLDNAVNDLQNALMAPVKRMLLYAQLWAVEVPALFLNALLRAQAFVISILTDVAVQVFRFGIKIASAFMQAMMYALEMTAKLVLAIAALPIVLPALGVKALVMFTKMFLSRLAPGFEAIGAAVRRLMSELKDLVALAMKEVLRIVVTPLRMLVQNMIDAMTTIVHVVVGLPVLIYRALSAGLAAIDRIVSEIVSSVVTFLDSLPSRIYLFILRVFVAVGGMFSWIIDNVANFAVVVLSAINRLLVTIAKTILGVFVGLPVLILRMIGAVASGIVVGTINLIATVFSSLRRALVRSVHTFLYDGVLGFIAGIYNFITQGIPRMILSFLGALEDAVETITAGVLNFFVEIPMSIVEGIESIQKFLMDEVLTFPEKVGNFIVGAIEQTVSMILSAVNALLTGGFNFVVGKTGYGFGKLFDAFVNFIVAFPAVFIDKVEEQFNRISKSLEDALSTLQMVDWDKVVANLEMIVNNVFHKLIIFFDNALGAFSGGGDKISKAWARITSAFSNAITRFVSSVPWDRLKQVWTDLKQFFYDLGIRLVKAISYAVNQVFAWLGTNPMQRLTTYVVGGLLSFYDGIANWVKGAKDFVNVNISGLGGSGMMKNLILGVLSLMNAGAVLAGQIMRVFYGSLQSIAKVVDIVVVGLNALWIAFTTMDAGPIRSTIVSGILSGMEAAIANTVPAPIINLFNMIFMAVGKIFGVFKDGGTAVGGIGLILAQTVDMVVSLVDKFTETFKQMAESIENFVTSGGAMAYINNFVTGLSKALSSGNPSAVLSYLKEQWSAGVGDLSKWMSKWVDKLFDDVAGIIYEGGWAGSILATLMKMFGKFGGVVGWVLGLIDALATYIWDLFSKDVAGSLFSVFDGITSFTGSITATGVAATSSYHSVDDVKKGLKGFFEPFKTSYNNVKEAFKNSTFGKDLKKTVSGWFEWAKDFGGNLMNEDGRKKIGEDIDKAIQDWKISEKLQKYVFDPMVDALLKSLRKIPGFVAVEAAAGAADDAAKTAGWAYDGVANLADWAGRKSIEWFGPKGMELGDGNKGAKEGAKEGVKEAMNEVPRHGEGGTFTTPHLAFVGDSPEVIVPFKKFGGIFEEVYGPKMKDLASMIEMIQFRAQNIGQTTMPMNDLMLDEVLFRVEQYAMKGVQDKAKGGVKGVLLGLLEQIPGIGKIGKLSGLKRSFDIGTDILSSLVFGGAKKKWGVEGLPAMAKELGLTPDDSPLMQYSNKIAATQSEAARIAELLGKLQSGAAPEEYAATFKELSDAVRGSPMLDFGEQLKASQYLSEYDPEKNAGLMPSLDISTLQGRFAAQDAGLAQEEEQRRSAENAQRFQAIISALLSSGAGMGAGTGAPTVALNVSTTNNGRSVAGALGSSMANQLEQLFRLRGNSPSPQSAPSKVPSEPAPAYRHPQRMSTPSNGLVL